MEDSDCRAISVGSPFFSMLSSISEPYIKIHLIWDLFQKAMRILARLSRTLVGPEQVRK